MNIFKKFFSYLTTWLCENEYDATSPWKMFRQISKIAHELSKEEMRELIIREVIGEVLYEYINTDDFSTWGNYYISFNGKYFSASAYSTLCNYESDINEGNVICYPSGPIGLLDGLNYRVMAIVPDSSKWLKFVLNK